MARLMNILAYTNDSKNEKHKERERERDKVRNGPLLQNFLPIFFLSLKIFTPSHDELVPLRCGITAFTEHFAAWSRLPKWIRETLFFFVWLIREWLSSDQSLRDQWENIRSCEQCQPVTNSAANNRAIARIFRDFQCTRNKIQGSPKTEYSPMFWKIP